MIMYMTFALIYTANWSFVKAATVIGLEIDSYCTLSDSQFSRFTEKLKSSLIVQYDFLTSTG